MQFNCSYVVIARTEGPGKETCLTLGKQDGGWENFPQNLTIKNPAQFVAIGTVFKMSLAN